MLLIFDECRKNSAMKLYIQHPGRNHPLERNIGQYLWKTGKFSKEKRPNQNHVGSNVLLVIVIIITFFYNERIFL